MRNGDAIAHRRGAQFLALQQDLENGPLILPSELGRLGGELLERLLLAVDFQRREDRLGCDQIGNRHGAFRGEVTVRLRNRPSKGGVKKLRQETGLQRPGPRFGGFYSNPGAVPTPSNYYP